MKIALSFAQVVVTCASMLCISQNSQADGAAAHALNAVTPTEVSQKEQQAPSALVNSAQVSEETAAPSLKEIVVTARRRQENLQDVPVSVNVFTSQDIADLGVLESKDLSELVPGLVWKGAGATARNNIFIRGVGNASTEYASSPGVAVYLDDIYLNSQSLDNFATYDVDRVEVLNGPQGTLYGQNTTGGAIKFVTTKPSLAGKLGGNFDGSVGNFNYRKGEFGLSIPLGGIAALRIAAMAMDRGGIYRDYLDGDSYGAKNLRSTRIQLLIAPMDRLTVLVMGTYGESNSDNVRYKRIDYLDPSSITLSANGPSYTRLCGDPQPGTAPGCTNLPVFFGIATPDLNHDPYALESYFHPGKTPEKNTVYGASATISYDFGDAIVKSITSYMRDKVIDISDVGGSAQNIASIDYQPQPTQYSEELRLASNGDARFRWTMGLFAFRERLRDDQAISISAFGFGFGSAYRQTTSSKAAYGEGSYRIAPRLDLTLGLRYSNDQKHMAYEYFNYMTDGRPIISYQDVVTDPALDYAPALSVDHSTTSNSVSGRVALRYKVSDDAMTYISLNRGFKAAEFNVGAATAATAQFVHPETLDALEIGVKSELFEHRMRWNVEGFYYDYKNKQESVFDTGLISLSNAQAHVSGVDGEVLLKPMRRLTMGVNFSVLSSRYTDYPDCTADGSSCTGNHLPNAPKFSGALRAAYDFPVEGHLVTIQGTANYRSSIDYSPTNVAYLRQSGYWLLGSRADVGLGRGMDLEFWIENLANERYFMDIYDVSALGFSEGDPGEPRTFGAEFDWHF